MTQTLKVDPVDIVRKVLLDRRFDGVTPLRHLVAEAKVLNAVKAAPHLWHDLGRRAYAALTSETVEQVRNATGVELCRVNREMGRVRNTSVELSQSSPLLHELRVCTTVYSVLCVHRQGSTLNITALR